MLYLDISSGKYGLINQRQNMPDYEIAIIFSGVKRTLVGSAYNTRVAELKSASYALKAFANLPYGSYQNSVLRDVPRAVFSKYQSKVYAMEMPGKRYDIGNIDSYQKVNKEYRGIVK